MKFIIVAGGQGTKVWPMSRETKPKQFQSIVGDKTLYEYQVETLLKGYSLKDIFVSTKKQYLHFIEELSPEISKKNIILEPDIKLNRGPGEGYATLKLAEKYPNEPFMIIQSDDIRTPEEGFIKMIVEAERLTLKHKKFITSGQKAVYPAMGCDYLKAGDKIETKSEIEAFEIESFVDRLSTYEETKDLIESFRVAVHTNHLCWYPEMLLNAYKKYKPEWYKTLMEIRDTFGKKDEEEKTEKLYSQMEAGTTEDVTKHVMKGGIMLINPFKWIDIGTWSSIYDGLGQYGKNYIDGNVVTIDTKNTLIKGGKDKIIATLGVEDLIIVDTGDALLVCKKDRAGDIKLILKNLEESGRERYL